MKVVPISTMTSTFTKEAKNGFEASLELQAAIRKAIATKRMVTIRDEGMVTMVRPRNPVVASSPKTAEWEPVYVIYVMATKSFGIKKGDLVPAPAVPRRKDTQRLKTEVV